MESRWYFFPGQTTENTKISDRVHALHITSSGWNDITHHLERKQRIQAAIDKERQYKESLKQGSQAMTKDWPNSVENLRLRKEEERNARISKKKEDKIQMFYKMRAEQEIVRKEYVDKVKKEMFTSKGYSRDLNSALILSETLYERDKQKEFNDNLKKRTEKIKNKFDQSVIESDEKQKNEDKEKEKQRREKEKKIAETRRQQIQEIEETRAATSKSRIEKEQRDQRNAAEEEERLKQFEKANKIKKQQEILKDNRKALENERKRQEILAKENAEMEVATQFYSEAKFRIDCLRKSKEKEAREEEIRQHEILANKVGAIQEAKDAAEDERIAKVVAERDEQEKIKKEEKAAKHALAIQERIDDRKQYLQRKQKEQQMEEEVKKWELLNRCKTAEVMAKYDEENRREKWNKMMRYRKDLLEQIEEDKEMRKDEKKIDEIISHVSFEEEDKMFLQYAGEVLNLAKSKKRSTYPIEKIIMEYKKKHNLLPPIRKCKCCKK